MSHIIEHLTQKYQSTSVAMERSVIIYYVA